MYIFKYILKSFICYGVLICPSISLAQTQTSIVSLNNIIPSPTNNESASWQILFEDPVGGINPGNFQVQILAGSPTFSNISISQPSGQAIATIWNITVNNIVGDGIIRLNFTNASLVTQAISNLPFNGNIIEIDRTIPTVNLSTTASAVTNVSPIPFTLNFSERIFGLSITDFVVTNGTISSLNTSNDRNFTFDFTPAAVGTYSVRLPASTVRDGAFNLNSPSNTISGVFTAVAPSVTISSPVGNPTNATSFLVNIDFTAPVTGFDVTDLVVTNASTNSFGGSGSSYSVVLSPVANGQATVQIPAGSAFSLVLVGNFASNTFSRTFDSVRPSAVIASMATDPTNVSPIPFRIIFSERVSGLSATDFSLVNGTISNFSAPDGITFDFSITPTLEGPVSVGLPAARAIDGAGNFNQTVAIVSRSFDATPPTLSISSTSDVIISEPKFDIIFNFSEPITGFNQSDVQLTNATLSNFSGSGDVFSATINALAEGEVTISVPSGIALDNAQNGNLASNLLSRNYLIATPILSVFLADTILSNNSSILFPDISAGETISRTFVIRNEGSADMSLTDLSIINPSAFDLDQITLPNNIAPGEALNFSVNLSAAVADNYAESLQINSNAANAGIFTLSLVATIGNLLVTVEESGELIFANEDVDFGKTIVNEDLVKIFTIENTSAVSSLNIEEVIIQNPVFELLEFDENIAPKSLGQFTIRLVADNIGLYESSITVNNNLADFSFQLLGEVAVGEEIPDVNVFNVVTPNGDGRHDFLNIEHIEFYPDNSFTLYTRWGQRIFELQNYDNQDNSFTGQSNRNEAADLISGTYYYILDKGDGSKAVRGYILLQR